MKTALAILLLGVQAAAAATYYVDYAGGDDSANGTSKATPWKRAPKMNGFSGTYTHAAGDRFVFKGGVTWPVTCFQMTVDEGGSSNEVRDYYGVDTSWYSGGSWTRPLFDFEDTAIGGGSWNAGAAVFLQTGNITFDNLELARFAGHPGTGSYGPMSISMVGTVNNVTVTNCVIRDWSFIEEPASGEDSNGFGGVGFLSGAGGGSGLRVTHCVLHQENATYIGGVAVRNIGTVDYNEIHHTSNAILSGGSIHHNHIHDMLAASDPASHGNAIETFSRSDIYANLIHDLASVVAPILATPDWSGGTGIDLIYNNVLYNVGGQTPIGLCTGGSAPGSIGFRVFNNTAEHNSAYCVQVGYQAGQAAIASLDVRNNHFITDGATSVCYDNVGALCGNITTATVSDNLVQTAAQAAAAGYVAGNYYAPTSTNSPTCKLGVDLSAVFTEDRLGTNRPAGAWDLGAYQMAAGSEPEPPTPTYNNINRIGTLIVR